MIDDIPLEVQALAVESAAVSYRAGVERHEDLALRKRWNPDLIPSERRMAEELAAASVTMRRLSDRQKARAADEGRTAG